MNTGKRIILALIIVTISISSCKKVRDVLIPTRVEGTVTDAETGEPIPNSTVYLFQSWSTNGGGSKVFGTYYTNEKGEFKIRECLPRYVEKQGDYKPEYGYKLLGENKDLFYCGTINGKNTTRDTDASANLEITRKNNVTLKLRKTGLIRFIAVDNPNIIASPLIDILDNSGHPISKLFNLSAFKDGKLELYVLPGWYKVNRRTFQEIIDFEVKYSEFTEIIVEY